jgi:hypothetical protein
LAVSDDSVALVAMLVACKTFLHEGRKGREASNHQILIQRM